MKVVLLAQQAVFAAGGRQRRPCPASDPLRPPLTPFSNKNATHLIYYPYYTVRKSGQKSWPANWACLNTWCCERNDKAVICRKLKFTILLMLCSRTLSNLDFSNYQISYACIFLYSTNSTLQLTKMLWRVNYLLMRLVNETLNTQPGRQLL